MLYKRLFLAPLMGALFLFSNPVLASDEIIDLKLFKGSAVYLDFWASWCVPCKKSFAWMNQMHKKYGNKGLQIIAVNVDENPADADKFLEKYPANFKIVRDPKGVLAEKYTLVGMPTALLFDAEGEQVGRHVGFRLANKQKYEDAIKEILPSTPNS